MTRHDFREVQGRFGHIDGEIRSAEAQMCRGAQRGSVRIVLSFYPWWEHPGYVAARAAGADGAFHYGEDAAREVVIEAIDPNVCTLSGHPSATDLVFFDEGPELWPYEDQADILCNSDVDRGALFEAVLLQGLYGVTRSNLEAWLSPYTPHRAPYSLGPLPYSLFHAVKDELGRMGASTYVGRAPVPKPLPVRLVIDDSVSVVAEGFVVDVPDFEHRPEWFRRA